jgi:hypothetical protein
MTWTKKTTMSVLPSANGWTFVGTNEGVDCSVSGGALNFHTQTGSGGTAIAYYRLITSLRNERGYEIQFRCKVNTLQSAYISGVIINDGKYVYSLNFSTAYYELNNGAIGTNVPLDTTVWRTFLIKTKGTVIEVWVDGVLHHTGATSSLSASNKIEFGDANATNLYNCDMDYDYLYYGINLPEQNDFYKIKFISPEGDLIAQADSRTGKREVSTFDFELNETGCGAFNISITNKDYGLRVGDIVEIYLFDETTPYYTGYIQKIPEEGKTDLLYLYSGYGLIAKLDEIVINSSYAATELSVIVTSILENEILPKKPEIVENTTKIEVTGYTATAHDFSLTKAKKAVFDLVNEAGNWVAGVDELKEFFFKARLTTIQQAAVKAISKHLSQFLPNQDNSGIVNTIYLKIGKATGGSNYISTIEDLPSQSDYGIRENVETAPTTDNSTDAQQWGNRLLTLKKDPIITASITGIDMLFLRERIRAEGKARIILLKGVV